MIIVDGRAERRRISRVIMIGRVIEGGLAGWADMIRQSVRAFEQGVMMAAGGQPIGQPLSAPPGTPPDPTRHGNRRQAPHPAWSGSPLICMACKRPGVRLPLAPRFPRSST